MSMTADQIVDRRRIRRKLVFWRFAGIVAVVLLVGAVVVSIVGRDAFPQLVEDQIARVSIRGFISDNRDRDELFAKIAKTDAVKAVIVAIDSTGGSTTGGEALFESLKKLAAEKPTVATIGTFGASAAYMAALATEHIVVRRSSITGSIGVVFQYPNIAELLDNLGVKVEDVKSAPLKAEPSPFRPTDPRARAVIAGVVSDTYNWFVDIVAEERELERGEALRLADGRIFTGRQALEADLVDAIGGEDAAVDWLADEKGIDRELPVRNWHPDDASIGALPFARAAFLWLVQKTGLAPDLFGGTILDRLLPESLKLDGLLSVWQGSDRGA